MSEEFVLMHDFQTFSFHGCVELGGSLPKLKIFLRMNEYGSIEDLKNYIKQVSSFVSLFNLVYPIWSGKWISTHRRMDHAIGYLVHFARIAEELHLKPLSETLMYVVKVAEAWKDSFHRTRDRVHKLLRLRVATLKENLLHVEFVIPLSRGTRLTVERVGYFEDRFFYSIDGEKYGRNLNEEEFYGILRKHLARMNRSKPSYEWVFYKFEKFWNSLEKEASEDG